MRLLIQRVISGAVSINGESCSSIGKGLVVFVGFSVDDGLDDIEWLLGKLIHLRIFNDHDSKMNLSIKEINGSILIISQFTLFASTKKGNRPSYLKSLGSESAFLLYNQFINSLIEIFNKDNIKTGIFGADMQVELINDGPVTILIDSKIRE